MAEPLTIIFNNSLKQLLYQIYGRWQILQQYLRREIVKMLVTIDLTSILLQVYNSMNSVNSMNSINREKINRI